MPRKRSHYLQRFNCVRIICNPIENINILTWNACYTTAIPWHVSSFTHIWFRRSNKNYCLQFITVCSIVLPWHGSNVCRRPSEGLNKDLVPYEAYRTRPQWSNRSVYFVYLYVIRMYVMCVCIFSGELNSTYTWTAIGNLAKFYFSSVMHMFVIKMGFCIHREQQ